MIELFAMAVLQVSVPPQHAQAYARIDTVAGYIGPMTACERLGYRLSSDFARDLEGRVYAEAIETKVPLSLAAEWAKDSGTRHSAQFQQELRRPLDEVKAGGDPVPIIQAMLDQQANRCREIIQDPIVRGLLTAGTIQEMEIARRATQDQFLEATGSADWQTPYMQERGMLLYILGACKALLPEDEHRRLFAAHYPPPSDQGRPSQWLAAEYQGGLDNAATLGMSTSQCAGVMRTAEADLGKARSSQ